MKKLKKILKVGDILIKNKKLYLAKEVDGNLVALDLERASGFIERIRGIEDKMPENPDDDFNYLTSIDYLIQSHNSQKVEEAKKILENKGHTVNYLGDGVYVIDQHTQKSKYAFGAMLIEVALEIQVDEENKKRMKELKDEQKRRASDAKKLKANDKEQNKSDSRKVKRVKTNKV